MVDTVRILDTFLDFGLSFHTLDLGGMLLSLLTSESIHESSSSSPPIFALDAIDLGELNSRLAVNDRIIRVAL